MFQQLKILHATVTECHEDVYTDLGKEIEPLVRSCNNLEELVDTAYVLRETSKLCNDMRKMCDVLRELSEKICCVIAIKDESVGAIKTEYASGTPNVKMMASIPKKKTHPEKFAALMEHLGIPAELWEEESDVVRPHWPGFVNHLTALAAAGKPLPPGIDADKTYPVYSLDPLRKKKGIQE